MKAKSLTWPHSFFSVILSQLSPAKPGVRQRRIRPVHGFGRMLFFAIIASATFLFLLISPSPALASPGLPGHWHGTPDPDACNTFNDCIYIFDICYQGQSQTLGSHDSNPIQHAILVEMIGASFGDCPPPPLTHGERCKLVDIDSPIIIGGDQFFTANFLGNIQSLRFKGESGEAFIAPLQTGFADGKKTATFSTMDSTGQALLSPGMYQVSCKGLAGTVGESLSVIVTR
jgi:hypothetical protein